MTGMALTWLALLAVLGAEIAGALSHRGWIGWLAAPIMALLIAGNFMNLRHASALSRIFAVAGLFWIVVMFGLGGADYLSRHDNAAGPHVGAE